MASRSASCTWCGSTFNGWGETGEEAQRDADANAANHAMSCPKNPANQD